LFRDLNLLRQAGVPLSFDERQQTAARDDGTLDFRVTVSGINEISWWILGYGDEAEVLEPPALRRLVAERAARMAQRYRALP
jgi:proteasome accessory factor B